MIAAAESTPSGVPPIPQSRSTPASAETANSAAETSPSLMKRIRAPASRICLTPSSWRGRSSMITVTSPTDLPLRSATLAITSPSGSVEAEQSAISGPPAIFSM